MSQTGERLLRVPEAAIILGWSRTQTYRQAQRRVLPVVKIPGGKSVRIPLGALQEWIRRNTTGGAGPAA
jgi:excisionase family DNA binding protein